MSPRELAPVDTAGSQVPARRPSWSFATAICLMVLLSAVGGQTRARAQEATRTASPTAHPLPASIASPADISRWIKQLGHDAYTVRRDAAEQLVAAGMSARQPLQALVDGPDPETRAAARRLVALIDRSEFHRRLEAFAADTDGEKGLTLPGWKQFQKLVGSDPDSRALFVDMQRQEGALLAATFDTDARSPGALLQSRLQRLVQWQNLAGDRTASPPLGSCATMVFLGSVPEISVSDESAVLVNVLLQRQPINEKVRSDHREDAIRRLAVGWLLNCPTKNEQVLVQRLETISTFGLEEALPLALDVVGGKSQYRSVHPYSRALAALIVGQLGGPEDIDRVEPLLDDVSICFPPQAQMLGRRAPSVQMRDVALVVLLQLTGQRPSDYGYISAQLQLPLKIYRIQSLFRENDQQRREAITKWRQWRTAQRSPITAAKAD